MSLRIYNTLSKEKELFEPVRPGKVGMYLCGPTVYKSPHIGHMVGPIIFDAIKRYLQYKGYEVTWIVNITDVEDKLIDAAVKKNATVQELAEKYTKEYFDCLNQLGIDSIDRFPKASEHIAEIIDMCAKLIEKGFAYSVEGNVWFDVSKDADYGKLSNRRVEDQESGLRATENTGKRNPADFALWKAAKAAATVDSATGISREPSWDSPWGKGRPGWHIECSAMSTKYLGPTFDIHGGGMDLMFPHHENELAQSECATGQTFAKFWLHNGLTRIKTKLASGEWADEKMSGSIGNVVAVRELIDRHGAELLRYMLLSTHYRRPIEFTDDVMAAAKKGLSVFPRLLERIERIRPQLPPAQPPPAREPDMEQLSGALLDTQHADFVRAILGFKMKFLEMMDDDFNTAGAIAVLHEMAGEINSLIQRSDLEAKKDPETAAAVAAATQSLKNLGIVLGLFRMPAAKVMQKDTGLADQLMKLLIQLRQTSRESKNFAMADAIRNGLTEIGVTLEDRPGGTEWRKE